MEPLEEILQALREMRETQIAAIARQKRAHKYLLVSTAIFFAAVLAVYLFFVWHTVRHP